jgi:hypothetical protein
VRPHASLSSDALASVGLAHTIASVGKEACHLTGLRRTGAAQSGHVEIEWHRDCNASGRRLATPWLREGRCHTCEKRLSVANVVAGTALFVALSGGAYAATIAGFVGGTGSIQGCVTRNGTLTVVKAGKKCWKHTTSLVFNAKGTAGAHGAQGAAGARRTGRHGTSRQRWCGQRILDPRQPYGAHCGVGLGDPDACRVSPPAGNFVMQADVQVENSGTNNAVSCGLAGGGLTNAGVLDVGDTGGGVEHGYIALGGGPRSPARAPWS